VKKLIVGFALLLVGCPGNVSVPTSTEVINDKSPVVGIVMGYHREASSTWPGRYESSTFYITVRLEGGLMKDIVVSQGFYELIYRSMTVYLDTNFTCILGVKD